MAKISLFFLPLPLPLDGLFDVFLLEVQFMLTFFLDGENKHPLTHILAVTHPGSMNLEEEISQRTKRSYRLVCVCGG